MCTGMDVAGAFGSNDQPNTCAWLPTTLMPSRDPTGGSSVTITDLHPSWGLLLGGLTLMAYTHTVFVPVPEFGTVAWNP